MGGRAGDLGAMGRVSTVAIDPDWLAGWVTESCSAQGVPVKVTDAGVLSRVGVLLGMRADGPRAHGAAAPSTRATAAPSQSPDGLHSAGVEAAGSGDTGGDDGVVEDGGDDRGLSLQGQARPAVA